MQQCNDLHIFNQASRIVLSILLRQTERMNEQIELSRIDKVRCWRLGIADEGLTEKSSASFVGEPVANLYRWEKIRRSIRNVRRRFGRASGRMSWNRRIKRCVRRTRLGVS